jgi:DNA-binding GntR family transcriptional regulator
MERVARHKTAVEFAVDQIKRRIVSQELPPGTRIDQTVLAEMLGLSRIPVRQALANLSDRGFVQLQAHRSAVVPPLSKSDMENLYALRRHLELWAAPDIARRADERLVDLLREINAALVSAARDGDLSRYMDLNRDFHFEILDLIPNPHLRRIIESLFDLTERYQWMCLSADGNLERSIQDHARIMGALESHDERELSEVLAIHSKKTADWFKNNVATKS